MVFGFGGGEPVVKGKSGVHLDLDPLTQAVSFASA